MSPDQTAVPPVISIVRGQPTTAQVTALVSLLAARAAAAAAAAGPQAAATESRSAWSDRSRQHRENLSPAPGAWRRSALPR